MAWTSVDAILASSSIDVVLGCYSVLGRTLLGPRLGSRLLGEYGIARRGSDRTRV